MCDRLQECYGSPEALERALFDKLERFPRITNKDPHLLRDLGDLLLEIDSAKSEGYIPGLLYLDTARGIHPIVDKLPFGLQEKWMTCGTRYKHDHFVSFPPFSVFAAFIRDEASMRNDPSFRSSAPQTIAISKVDNYLGRRDRTRMPISVNRTEVVDWERKQSTEKRVEDPNKECPIHKKPHALRKCRAFREKSLEERKAYLKQNHICFRCCASSSHQAVRWKFTVRNVVGTHTSPLSMPVLHHGKFTLLQTPSLIMAGRESQLRPLPPPYALRCVEMRLVDGRAPRFALFMFTHKVIMKRNREPT